MATPTPEQALAQALAIVKEHPDYKILQRLPIVERYNEDGDARRYIGVALDTESTGLDTTKDKIIELALISFEFDMEGRLYRLLDVYQGLEDPGVPLSDEVKEVTGLTDEDLKGQSFDRERIKEILGSALFFVAHNSEFDRQMMEREFPELENSRWACTFKGVDWSKEGVAGRQLGVLAAHYGYFFDAHRAEIDVRGLIHLMTQDMADGTTVLKKVTDSVKTKAYRLWAVGAPFDAKDDLKAHGYQWSPGDAGLPKAWNKEVLAEDMPAELTYLANDIYRNPALRSLQVEEVSALTRYSSRRGNIVPTDEIVTKFAAETEDLDSDRSPR